MGWVKMSLFSAVIAASGMAMNATPADAQIYLGFGRGGFYTGPSYGVGYGYPAYRTYHYRAYPAYGRTHYYGWDRGDMRRAQRQAERDWRRFDRRMDRRFDWDD